MKTILLALALTSAALPAAEPHMSWLENDALKVGVDLDLGGAITWLSKAGEATNLINSKDWGRQVQMSFYSGPVPYAVGDNQPAKVWAGLGWNPIQVGDYYGHRSRVLESTNSGGHLYVKCAPMQWPLNNVPGECTFESWLELSGPRVLVHGRLNNMRSDHTQYAARGQELPAVYTNAPWHRLLAYTGAHPFTGEPITDLVAKPPPQWDRWMATERWTALVDDRGWGLGVWNPETVTFGGGFNGRPGVGGPADAPCGYIAPLGLEVLDHDIVYDFRYELMLGTVEEIRAEFCRPERQPPRPHWDFAATRQGWHYLNATDGGWPIHGELAVEWHASDPQIISPTFFCREPVHAVIFEMAANQDAPGELFWGTLERGICAEQRVPFALKTDRAMREYRIDLPNVEHLTQLRLDPAGGGEGKVRLRSVRLE